MPEPLPSLLMIPALALAALVVELVVELVLVLDVLVVALDPAVDVEDDDDTESTMVSLYCSVIGIKMDNLSRA